MTTGYSLARRPAGSFLPGAVVAAWLFCVGFAAPVGAVDPVDQVDVWINVTLSGVTQVQLNVSELNTTRLLEKLGELKTSDNQAFQALAKAFIKEMNTQLDASGVSVVECSVGSYTDPLLKLCVPCLAGKYSEVSKSVSVSDCTNCAAGTYSTKVGASSGSTCATCPTGTFSTVEGASNVSQCVACQDGATAVAGSQGANACVCKDGYYLMETGVCSICLPGYYCSGGQYNRCPQGIDNIATSPQGSSVVESCFCKAGYYGRPLGGNTGCTDCALDMTSGDAVCTECDVGSFCPGNLISKVAQRYTCPDWPDKSTTISVKSTTGVKSTSVNDCVCKASYKKKVSDSATRTYVVGATPCACSVDGGGGQVCNSVAGCNQFCGSSEACPPGAMLTCPQGNLNLITGNGYYAGPTQWWLIAPSSPLTTGVTLTFSAFQAYSGDTLKIWQCVNATSCSSAVQGNANGWKSFTGSPASKDLSISTTAGYTAMYLQWTVLSTSPGAAGWKATYGSNQSCALTTIPLALSSIVYDKTAQSEQFFSQVPDTWPVVLWVGDTLTLTVPSSTAFVAVDVRSSQTNPASSVMGPLGWSAGATGTYYVVDPNRASTRSRLLVVLPSDPVTLMVYYSVAGTSAPYTFTLTGGMTGTKSPDIVLTVGDTLVMSRMTGTYDYGVAILKSYTSSAVFEYADGVVGQSDAANALASLTWDTSASTPGLYYYATPASFTGVAVTVGKIYLMARPGGAQCLLCSADEYCYDGNPLRCPANSNSPSGSTGIENCTCTAGYARELTDMATYVNSHTTDSGGRHSCVVTEGGGLVCWGANEAYQLGLGRVSTWEPPTKVDITGVQNVSLGDTFTCVILDVGEGKRTRCWGSNYYGQLGLDSSALDSGGTLPSACGDARLGGSSTPYTYTTLHLACALHSCCAVIQTGAGISVTCWGRGDYGQLGKGATYRKNVGTLASITYSDNARKSYADTGTTLAQVSFTALGTPLMVTMGGYQACALLQSAEGAVTHCWGHNMDGALGVGSSSADALNPAAVSLGKAGVASSYARTVSCYSYVCCAVMSVSFQVKCWGRGAGGRLGNGIFNVGSTALSMGANLQPVQLGAYKYAMDVNVGSVQTCALLGDNSVKCWGSVAGQILGDNPPIDMYDLLPSLQLTSGRVALQIGGNGPVTCAVLSDYRAACWGNNDYRQLGGSVLANAGGGSSVVQAGDANMTIVNFTGLSVESMHSTGVPTTLVCSMCSENYYCSGGGMPALKCPNNTASPAKASSVGSCACLQGYAALTSGSSACQLCGAGSLYCQGGATSSTCPAQSATTAVGSYALSQCSCLPGYTGVNGAACGACGTGTYKDASGSGACTQCPAGTFSAVTGLNGSWGCAPCAAGKYSLAGAAACISCDPGKAAKTGSSACVSCGTGFYSFSDSEGCLPCPVGTYDQQGIGTQYTCTSCQAGYASPILNATNSSTCKICAAGFRSDTGSASCTGCDAGQYSIGGTAVCEPCPANSESLGNSSYGKCTCKAGFYKKFALDNTAFTCEQCPGGQWAGANATACTLCPSGTASASVGAVSAATCGKCLAGAFAAAGSAVCAACPAWSYSLEGNGSCTNCTLGQYSAAGSSVCGSCAAGRYSDGPIANVGGCQTCPRGYYCLGAIASAGGVQVRACPTGTFAPSGSNNYQTVTSCGACPAGQYCPTPTLQAPCPAGTTSAASSSSQLQCLCVPGYVCQYSKVINAVVTLLMTGDAFAAPNVQAKFLEAVAFASNTPVQNVRIVSFVGSNGPPPTQGRRLLQVDNIARRGRGGDGELHVFLEIAGGEGEDIVNLDGHLVAAGLAPSVDHAWYAPHAVDVSKEGALM